MRQQGVKCELQWVARGRAFLLCAAAGALSMSPLAAAAPATTLTRISGDFGARVLASGLDSPDGLAIHPQSGELYVVEENAGRVSVIRDGKAVPVIDKDWHVIDDIPFWAITDECPRQMWLNNRLQNPEGIAFSADGKLYVTEDVAGGRLLEFTPDSAGRYTVARAIPVPWIFHDVSWEEIAVATDGRLYMAGSSAERKGPGLFFGAVLGREVDGKWSAIDYSPFVSFSSVCLSRDEDILVVGDETAGSVTWWDTDRQLAIGAATGILGRIEDVCLLPDGSIVAVDEGSTGGPGASKKGRLVRINPQTGAQSTLADGFGTIESVVAEPESGALYVSEDSSGSVLELKPRDPMEANEYLLMRSISTFEVMQGLAPKKWPAFLSMFMKKLGIEPQDEGRMAKKEARRPELLTLTPEEFAKHIPFVAGMVKSTPLQAGNFFDPDPVQRVDFIIFFPGKIVSAHGVTTPSLGLFSAVRRSGKIERTTRLGNFIKSQSQGVGKWAQTPAELYLPVPTCAAGSDGKGMSVNVSFLGMDMSDDYHMTFTLGPTGLGHMVVSPRNSDAMSSYELGMKALSKDGREMDAIIVAGLKPKRIEDYRWLEIGYEPFDWPQRTDETPLWLSRWIVRESPMLLALLREREQKIVMAWKNAEKKSRAVVSRGEQDKTIRAGADPTAPEETSFLPVQDTEEPDKQAETPALMPAADANTDKRAEKDREADLTSLTNILLSRALEAWGLTGPPP